MWRSTPVTNGLLGQMLSLVCARVLHSCCRGAQIFHEMSKAIVPNPPADGPSQKEVWVRRFATAVFLANNQVSWQAATELGARFWIEFGSMEPEDIARTFSTKQ